MKHPMRILSAVAVAAAVADASAVHAQLACAKRHVAIERLQHHYNEHRAYAGVLGNGAMIETYVSPAGDFSILITRPDGMSCLLAAGDTWTPVKKKPPQS